MDVALSRSSSDLASTQLTCRSVDSVEELADHTRIRQAVFVDEQSLFEQSDQDAYDLDPTVQHVVGYVDGVAAGTVRLYRLPSPDGAEVLWKGDRLAVLPRFRHVRLGSPLVRYAVSTAGAAGGDRMIAFVQMANVVFFRRLGWTLVGEPMLYVGVPHQQMSIDLT